MIFSGIRAGAWDYLKWGNVFPMIRNEQLVAAKMIVYAGEPDEHFTFISLEAYYALKSWMEFRKNSGEIIKLKVGLIDMHAKYSKRKQIIGIHYQI